MGEMRRVERLAAEHGANGAGFVGRIGLGQYPLLVAGVELAAPGFGEHLQVGHHLGPAWRYAPGGTKTAGRGAAPFTYFFMSCSFSALYRNYRAGKRLIDLGTDGTGGGPAVVSKNIMACTSAACSELQVRRLIECSFMKYRVYLEQDEDGVFVATCPALPGCVSQGGTRLEATVNIREAIEGYLKSLRKHGDPVPPSILEEIIEVAG